MSNNKMKIKFVNRIVAVIVCLFFVFLIFQRVTYTKETTILPSSTVQSNKESIQIKDPFYEEGHKKNSDYLGHLSFENDLVDQYIVQGPNNDKYINMSWDLEESSSGAAFLDYRNDLKNQNLIIYGHYVYKDENKMFSPLHKLTEQSNYEENKLIKLALKYEIRNYIVTNVFYYEMDNEKLEYFHPEYTEEKFSEYFLTIKEKEFYDTGESIAFDDKILTLQTCVRNRDDLRLIILAKQIKDSNT